MSSDRPARHRTPSRGLPLLALFATAVMLGLACGHKKAPKPPPSKVPQRVDLKAHQRGQEAILHFAYPTTTISGTLLDGVGRVEIWRLDQEVPEFAIEMLSEEEARREEAQALLDELGLSLYETPAVEPGVPGTPGVPSDPGAPIVPPATGAEAGDEGPATDAPAATSETPASDDADEPEAADEGGEDGDEADERGEEEGDAAPELSEEEQLQARIEAARNLLRSPPTPRSTFIQATLKDFRSDSQLWFELEEPALDSTLIGDRLFLRLPLPPRPAEGPEVGFVIAARVASLQGKESDFSNLVSLLPEPPPPAPQEVTVEAQSDGIHVDWTAEVDPKAGFRVYRREAQARIYGEPVGTVLANLRSFVDRQAIYGARYIYTVTSVAKLSPLLESEVSSEHEIDYQDRFGPAIPGGLVAFPEAGRVRLLWTPVADPDLAGYEVLRRAAGEAEPRLVTAELVTGGQYLDQGVPSGEWFYVVRAVDTTGNRGAESTEAPARVP